MHVDTQGHIGGELSTYLARSALLDNPDPDSVACGHPEQPAARRYRVEHNVAGVLRRGLEHQIDDVTLRKCEIQEVLVHGSQSDLLQLLMT
jgi:hypothetical protein